MARRTAGNVGECQVEVELTARGIPFSTEEELRRLGFAKTPDVRLDMPIGVLGADGRPCLVHWIESKNMFGDPDTHRSHMQQVRIGVGEGGALLRPVPRPPPPHNRARSCKAM